MRSFAALLVVLLCGCGQTVTSSSFNAQQRGLPYSVPKGMVPISLFADGNGIGLTIASATLEVDNEAGPLLASLNLSPFNNEDIKISADPATGYLTTITSNSDSQLLEIVAEAAKSARRIALQNALATALAERVVVYADVFDPLSRCDVERVNAALNSAAGRAAAAFRSATGGKVFAARDFKPAPIEIVVHELDGSVAQSSGDGVNAGGVTETAKPGDCGPAKLLKTDHCRFGLCVRSLVSRVVRVSVDGAWVGGKVVRVPARELVAIDVPSTALADQDIDIKIENGVLKQYNINRDSEALALVKLPGAVLGGLVAGVVQQLEDEKSVLDKRKALADSEKALVEAEKAAAEAAAEAVNADTTGLQNATVTTGAGSGDAVAAASTFYLYSETLERALKGPIERVGQPLAPRKDDAGQGQTQHDNNSVVEGRGPPLVD